MESTQLKQLLCNKDKNITQMSYLQANVNIQYFRKRTQYNLILIRYIKKFDVTLWKLGKAGNAKK